MSEAVHSSLFAFLVFSYFPFASLASFPFLSSFVLFATSKWWCLEKIEEGTKENKENQEDGEGGKELERKWLIRPYLPFALRLPLSFPWQEDHSNLKKASLESRTLWFLESKEPEFEQQSVGPLLFSLSLFSLFLVLNRLVVVAIFSLSASTHVLLLLLFLLLVVVLLLLPPPPPPLLLLLCAQPVFHFDCCSFTNDPAVIRKNPRAVAINTAYEMDLTGRVYHLATGCIDLEQAESSWLLSEALFSCFHFLSSLFSLFHDFLLFFLSVSFDSLFFFHHVFVSFHSFLSSLSCIILRSYCQFWFSSASLFPLSCFLWLSLSWFSLSFIMFFSSLTCSQCSQDSIGTVLLSGVGSQLDFLRGATLSPGGLPIIALPSVNERGESNTVNILKRGAGLLSSLCLFLPNSFFFFSFSLFSDEWWARRIEYCEYTDAWSWVVFVSFNFCLFPLIYFLSITHTLSSLSPDKRNQPLFFEFHGTQEKEIRGRWACLVAVALLKLCLVELLSFSLSYRKGNSSLSSSLSLLVTPVECPQKEQCHRLLLFRPFLSRSSFSLLWSCRCLCLACHPVLWVFRNCWDSSSHSLALFSFWLVIFWQPFCLSFCASVSLSLYFSLSLSFSIAV